MQFYGRFRWCTALLTFVFAASVAFGDAAIRADDSAPRNNDVGSLGAPPPTAVPTATTVATMSPTTAAATPMSTPAASAATSGTPAASAASSDDVQYNEGSDNGSPKNIVKVQNKTNNRLRVRGKIQLNHIPGDTAQPENDAEAYSSCTNCSTFAVALQINLISKTATTIAPKNTAIAVNYMCSNCHTVADAYQYVVQVDDPSQTPDNVKDLINQMQDQLNAAARDKDATVGDTEAKIKAVIMQFTALGQSLYTQRDQKDDDNSPGATVPSDATVLTPTPTASAPSSTASATPASPTATP